MKWFELMASSKQISVATIMEYKIPITIPDIRSTTGLDERFIGTNEKEDGLSFQTQFQTQLHYLYWLQLLEKTEISTLEKIKIVQETELFLPTYIINMEAGGLMRDFNNVF